MIVDKVQRLPLYKEQIPGSEEILEAFQRKDPSVASCEVREKSYAQKAEENRRFEVHFSTIDLMIAREGAEVIHICPMEDLTAAEPLPKGADGRKMDGAAQGTAVVLKKGYFCAIFPGEAHMVGGKTDGPEESIEKWVVKVPSPVVFCEKEQ
ncbi:MAG: YhcH/YjgK/YiaL family protein [Blautia sp.]|nr:YhcH/YjgK/YiaL family protein [Blautia sp.]